ncbi:hypothetical protein [Mesorhizobium ciceri]|uniref:Uncharacterized protein n=1 Tax=Mesorhizobium ciceri biovar biserrulae (strain HAMBI 2942 / LMG 23838 / WSM1271) TaxID=765698 RepID=E8T7T3_MESCW|nr:hypothetical protein [Mesorhizobium ciceri]ADV12934.1 hypothetical protein Mesci_3817 [Mesorhizobium ciceri biovar biserrulae WSM1271]
MTRAAAKAASADTGAEKHIKKLWNGGERLRAAEAFKAAEFDEDQADAILAEFPDLRDLISE